MFVSCWNKAELDDVLCALHADEVKQVAVGMLGKAAIKVGPTASLLTNHDHPSTYNVQEICPSSGEVLICVG